MVAAPASELWVENSVVLPTVVSRVVVPEVTVLKIGLVVMADVEVGDMELDMELDMAVLLGIGWPE